MLTAIILELVLCFILTKTYMPKDFYLICQICSYWQLYENSYFQLLLWIIIVKLSKGLAKYTVSLNIAIIHEYNTDVLRFEAFERGSNKIWNSNSLHYYSN